MDFQISEEHNMMRASVKQMLSKYEHRKKEWREMTHRDHKFNYELWNEFAEPRPVRRASCPRSTAATTPACSP